MSEEDRVLKMILAGANEDVESKVIDTVRVEKFKALYGDWPVLVGMKRFVALREFNQVLSSSLEAMLKIVTNSASLSQTNQVRSKRRRNGRQSQPIATAAIPYDQQTLASKRMKMALTKLYCAASDLEFAALWHSVYGGAITLSLSDIFQPLSSHVQTAAGVASPLTQPLSPSPSRNVIHPEQSALAKTDQGQKDTPIVARNESGIDLKETAIAPAPAPTPGPAGDLALNGDDLMDANRRPYKRLRIGDYQEHFVPDPIERLSERGSIESAIAVDDHIDGEKSSADYSARFDADQTVVPSVSVESSVDDSDAPRALGLSDTVHTDTAESESEAQPSTGSGEVLDDGLTHDPDDDDFGNEESESDRLMRVLYRLEHEFGIPVGDNIHVSDIDPSLVFDLTMRLEERLLVLERKRAEVVCEDALHRIGTASANKLLGVWQSLKLRTDP